MKKNEVKSKSNKPAQPASKTARAAALKEVVRLTGKDPLVAFAETACGKLKCMGCNGKGTIERGSVQVSCPRCHGSTCEKLSATAMLNARYKLATFFYAPRKAEETSGTEGDQEPERG